jgi:hypothetical protein
MTARDIEDGIRAYLDALGRPEPKPTVDREAVRALRAQAKAEADPINKLRLLAQAEEAATPKVAEAEDISGLEAVFVAEASTWADEEGIPVTAFQALGVDDDVLRRAGFTLPPGGRRSASISPRSASSSSSSGRAPRLDIDEVLREAKDLGHTWKLADLAGRIDRDVATTRNYLHRLIADGKVEVVGDAPKDPGTRGRAPKLYAVS